MKTQSLRIDKGLFAEIFELIFQAYENEKGIFGQRPASVVGPQFRFCPKAVTRGDPNHLYWLALVALSDKRTNSTVLYRNFALMFDDHPKLFDRNVNPSPEEMTRLFREYKIALPVKEISFFLERKTHLDTCFNGNPCEIYTDVTELEGLMKKLKTVAKKNGIKNIFPGAKEKIFSLLAMFLREYVDLVFAEVIPVDVWVQSICASTGVLKGKGHISHTKLGHQLRPLMRAVFEKYRHVHGGANATWILGKFGCTLCGGTDTSKTCPVYHRCKGPFIRVRHKVSGKHLGQISMPLNHKPKRIST